MKTKEIDVWVASYVDTDCFDGSGIELDDGNVCGDMLSIDNVEYFRAKLIVEIPEQKIEITESQLQFALKALRQCNGHEYREIKERLGFKS